MSKRTFASHVFGSAVAAFLILFITSPLHSQSQGNSTETPAAAHMRALNNSLLNLHSQMQHADSNTVPTLRSNAAIVIGRRAAALVQLIQTNPHAALSFAFSPELLSDLASKFPESSTLLESQVTVTGPIEHWIADYPDKTSRSIWRMSTGGRTLDLHFAGKEPSGQGNGQLIIATGVIVGSEMAVDRSALVSSSALTGSQSGPFTNQGIRTNLSPVLALFIFGIAFVLPGYRRRTRITSRRVLSALKQTSIYALIFVLITNTTPSYAQNSCANTGVQNVAVLLVTFPGAQPPSNINYQNVHDMFFSAVGPSLDGYWREASYGQTSATGDVFGWYTLDASSANCGNLTALRDAAISAAANAGVPIQNYNRIFIVTTDFGCGWTGLSINGCSTLSSPNGSFLASAAFLDASWQRSQSEGEENAAHEGGHGMGLAHAQSRTWSSEPLGLLGDAGTVTEYGDPFSVMSVSNSGHYSTPHKAEILNWIAAGTNYQVVQSNGTWKVQPLEISPAGLVALKVQRGTGNNSWLWVEYKQPIGIYESQWAPSGALIHYEDSTTAAHTQLLDFTPGDSNLYNGALMPGSTWTDPYSNVSITLQSADPTGATVSVNYGPNVCTAASPTVAASPVDPSIYPGNNATYNVTVTSNDSSGCPANTLTMSSDQPSGWPTSFSANSVTLNPGQSAMVTMYKSGPSGTPPGTYAVNANASDSAHSGSGIANVTVMSAPSLIATLSVSGTSFTRPSTASMSVSVTNGGIPASGAKVTFVVTLPNGSTTTQGATTGSNGVATWNYKIGTKSAPGNYSVVAQETLSSGRKSTQTATSNTANFTVQ